MVHDCFTHFVMLLGIPKMGMKGILWQILLHAYKTQVMQVGISRNNIPGSRSPEDCVVKYSAGGKSICLMDPHKWLTKQLKNAGEWDIMFSKSKSWLCCASQGLRWQSRLRNMLQSSVDSRLTLRHRRVGPRLHSTCRNSGPKVTDNMSKSPYD